MNIEKIIISGDSFVHGFDLCYDKFGIHPRSNWLDATRNFTDEQNSVFNDLRLSGQLKKFFKCEVVDFSYPGDSNDYIANSIITYIEENKNTINPETTLIIAGWSEPDRFPFYLEHGIINVNLPIIKQYIEAAELEHPQTDGSRQRIADYSALMELYDIWHAHDTMSYTGYFHHTALITMLQSYLDKMHLKYCFFNSLPTYPMKPNYRTRMKDYSDHVINWSAWYPSKDKSSYEWDWASSNMKKSENYVTETGHPSILSVEEHSKNLCEFIKKHY